MMIYVDTTLMTISKKLEAQGCSQSDIERYKQEWLQNYEKGMHNLAEHVASILLDEGHDTAFVKEVTESLVLTRA